MLFLGKHQWYNKMSVTKRKKPGETVSLNFLLAMTLRFPCKRTSVRDLIILYAYVRVFLKAITVQVIGSSIKVGSHLRVQEISRTQRLIS